MTNAIELQYFFDPFCGWCYASAPALAGLARTFAGRLELFPTGLFAAGRPISSIADHAWRNDQRIAAMTGQVFSDDYRRKVLLAPDGVFDSGPATLALGALGVHDALLELQFLHAVQIARYVDGRDTSRVDEVAKVAVDVAARHGAPLEVEPFADRLRNDGALRERTLARMEAAQGRMARLNIQGAPQLVAIIDGKTSVLSGGALYQGPEPLLAAIADLAAVA